MRPRKVRWKQTSRPKIVVLKKLSVVCICKQGNCEGFCNGIGNVDIRKKSILTRKKQCGCRKR